jgi:fructose/tagatose bisphosphate aldolase
MPTVRDIPLHKSDTPVFQGRKEFLKKIKGVRVDLKAGTMKIDDDDALRKSMDLLAFNAVDFGTGSASPDVMSLARWMILMAGNELGVIPTSIARLYDAMGRGEIDREMTVPAVNIRMNSYESATALFGAAAGMKVNALVQEIARSEIGYTSQRPVEYRSVIVAAALKAGYRGPVVLQGDHFQLNMKKMREGGDTAEKEMGAVKEVMDEAVRAGFGSIDLDTSTLELRDHENLPVDEQLRPNFEAAAKLTLHARQLEKRYKLPWSLSLGGESGEVGTQRTSLEEYRAYQAGLQAELSRLAKESGLDKLPGPNKISINTGTVHGGTPMPDGTIAEVNIGFDTLREIAEAARADGVIVAQHGASTLDPKYFRMFVDYGVGEVHLATGFQNLTYDAMPASLYEKIADWLATGCESAAGTFEKVKAGKLTSAQAIYKERKRGAGHFKESIWRMDGEARGEAFESLYSQFAFLFEQLNVQDTIELVKRYVPMPGLLMPFPKEGEGVEAGLKAHDDLSLGD